MNKQARHLTLLNLILLVFMVACDKQENTMHAIASTLKSSNCEVFFFKSWSTYQHPVTPVDPLTVTQALSSPGFYRAWMCNKMGSEYFVLFEGLESTLQATDFKVPEPSSTHDLLFYAYTDGKEPGTRITEEQMLDQERFYANLPTDSNTLSLVELKKGIRYEYLYSNDGTLEKTIVTDFDGNVKEL